MVMILILGLCFLAGFVFGINYLIQVLYKEQLITLELYEWLSDFTNILKIL